MNRTLSRKILPISTSSPPSPVSATIPWQEGREEDFADLREGLRRLRAGEALGGEGSSEESSEEDEADPGEGDPGARILWAAQHNRMDIAKELIARSPKLVGSRDSDLYTPLHRASYNNHLQMATLLLKEGADPLATTADGWTPLHSAAKWNCSGVAELLLAATPVNCVTRGGQTPLHLACLAGSSRETVELLLAHQDIDPTLANSQGDTPRMVAARNGGLAELFDAVEPGGVRRARE